MLTKEQWQKARELEASYDKILLDANLDPNVVGNSLKRCHVEAGGLVTDLTKEAELALRLESKRMTLAAAKIMIAQKGWHQVGRTGYGDNS